MKILACAALSLLALSATRPAPALPADDGPDALVLFSAGLDGILVDGRDQGLARALRMLDERLMELGRDLGGDVPIPPLAIELLSDVLANPFCLRLGFANPADPRTLRAQITVRCPGDGTGRRFVARLEQILAGMGAPIRTDDAGVHHLSSPAGPITFGVDETSPTPTLQLAIGGARPETFEFPASGLPEGQRPALYLRWDGSRLGTFAAMAAHGMGRKGARMLSVFEGLGFVGERAQPITWALAQAEDHALTVSRWRGYRALSSSLGTLVDEPLDEGDFARVPADATFASLGQVRLDRCLAGLDRFADGTSQRIRQGMLAALGVDPQTQLLDHMGPSVGCYTSRAAGGGLLSMVAFLEVSDPGAVSAALERIGETVRTLGQAHTQGRVSLRSWARGETACTTLVFPGLPVPLEPSWAISGDALLVAASPVALRAALDQRARQTSLLDHPRLAGFPRGSMEGLTGFSFLDTTHFLGHGYGLATMGASSLANALRSPYDQAREPGEILPSLDDLSRDARPFVCWTRFEGEDLVSVGILNRSWAVNGTAVAGTPLMNAYGGVGTIGIIASISIPRLLTARLSANENAAIATLRSVSAAQAQMQWSAGIDCDGDGNGEYAFFGELAGSRPMRVASPGGAAWGEPGLDTLDRPYMSMAFGQLQDDGTGDAVVERSGYLFKMFLPGKARGRSVPGIAEQVTRSSRPGTDVDGGEAMWCCYAWPLQAGKTGNRVFFVNQEGTLWMSMASYSGTHAHGGEQPAFDAAFNGRGDMSSSVGEIGQDGEHWFPVD